MGKYAGIISVCLFFSLPLFAAKTDMTYEQYETELAQLQQQEKAVKEQIAQAAIGHRKPQAAARRPLTENRGAAKRKI